MKAIIDLLTLRPVWTQRGLEVVWCGYVVATLLHLAWLYSFFLWPMATVSSSAAVTLIDSTLFAFLNLALVRIFLELAVKFLITPGKEANAART